MKARGAGCWSGSLKSIWQDGATATSPTPARPSTGSTPAEANVLFVALGSPRQELWIAENLDRLRPVLCMGVGGSFDVLSGKARRAPLVFRRSGTEWLFRLLMHPKKNTPAVGIAGLRLSSYQRKAEFKEPVKRGPSQLMVQATLAAAYWPHTLTNFGVVVPLIHVAAVAPQPHIPSIHRREGYAFTGCGFGVHGIRSRALTA